jgi:hypothetical protein
LSAREPASTSLLEVYGVSVRLSTTYCPGRKQWTRWSNAHNDAPVRVRQSVLWMTGFRPRLRADRAVWEGTWGGSINSTHHLGGLEQDHHVEQWPPLAASFKGEETE